MATQTSHGKHPSKKGQRIQSVAQSQLDLFTDQPLQVSMSKSTSQQLPEQHRSNNDVSRVKALLISQKVRIPSGRSTMLEPTNDSIIDMLNKRSPSRQTPSKQQRLITKKTRVAKPPRKAPSSGDKARPDDQHHWIYTNAPKTKAASEMKSKKDLQPRAESAVLNYTFTMNNNTLLGKIDTTSTLQPEFLRDDRSETKSNESLKKIGSKQAQRKYYEFMQRDQLKQCRVNLIRQLLDDNLKLKQLQRQNVISKNRDFYDKTKQSRAQFESSKKLHQAIREQHIKREKVAREKEKQVQE